MSAPTATALSAAELRHFKTVLTDENALIAEVIAALLPPNSGLIVDVGAGLGDIAGAAFPDRPAILIDVLSTDDIPPASHLHQRVVGDFLDFELPAPLEAGTLLFSHVLQYLDGVPKRLLARLARLDPRYLITVLNDDTGMHREVRQWLEGAGITHNGEAPISGFPPGAYKARAMRSVRGTITCRSFAELARQLTSVIFDCQLASHDLLAFEQWLGAALERPSVVIDQTVTLYERRP